MAKSINKSSGLAGESNAFRSINLTLGSGQKVEIEGRTWAESKLKAITGGDEISARFVRQDFFRFTPTFKLMIAGNHKPRLRSVDEAMRRRFHLIPFAVTIPEADRDKDLSEKLKPEWPAILRWMVDGCLKWQEIGLSPPQAVIDATAAYLETEDTIATWIEERCECGKNYRDTSGNFLGPSSFASTRVTASTAPFVAGASGRSPRRPPGALRPTARL
jgi:P4 family phage/plasmid primase-like protien